MPSGRPVHHEDAHGGGAGEPRRAFPTLAGVVGLALSTLLVGIALFALVPAAPLPLGRHVAAAGAALVVWCYCDGFVGRMDWGLAAVEGLLRLRLALEWAALLLDVLGPRGG